MVCLDHEIVFKEGVLFYFNFLVGVCYFLVLLDSDGHAHLTDFNIAVRFDNRKSLKSHSGTLAYMAPEIFEDKGYLWQIDWWSLGVILYECIYGKRPFRGNSSEQVANSIMNGSVTFHPTNSLTKMPVNLSQDCINFISGLLERDVTKRLGCGPLGPVELFEHPWFSSVDWNEMENKRVQPSFVPDVRITLVVGLLPLFLLFCV
jgi:serine/threonine kinase 32